MTMIKLQSRDGRVFQVDLQIACASECIKDMYESLGHDPEDDGLIPVPNVDGDILEKVITWITHHKDDPTPAEENNDNQEKRTDIPSWDADFLKVDQETLFDLLEAANYLDVDGLMDIICKTVANMIKGKTVEEIRKQFHVQGDFTPEEEEEIRKQYEWCQDR